MVLLHEDKKQASAWTQSFMMEPCNSLDPILGHVDPSIVQGYKRFMQEVIIQAICHHHLNFNTLNQYLFDFNKELFDTFCQNVISNYEMYASPKIKSYGI